MDVSSVCRTFALVLLIGLPLQGQTPNPPPGRPNVVVILTDDQGYGDLGSHGNPAISTPRLDRLARESVRLRQFYVNPVCSPTRASLLTGRYNYRTGVVDTFRGRSILFGDEVTLAEMLGPAGYRTGIFGKWHLGDNAPGRPIDQGFAESFVIKGGGVGQASDPPGGGPGNFNPVVLRNGILEPSKGYSTTLFTDEAIRFILAEKSHPFFVTLAYNVPHVPLDVPEPLGRSLDPKDTTGRIYAMLAEVDRNVERLLDKLDQLGIGDNTIVWFLSDNGPQQSRFNGGLRNHKGSVYDGGIRVPSFVRWRTGLPADRDVDTTTAHIDLVPTMLAACGVAPPSGVKLDGRDLLPLLRATAQPVVWPDRNLFLQWHRGDVPERGRNFAVRGPRFKLVQPVGASGAANVNPPPLPDPLPLELYDMAADPGEQTNLAATHPDEVARLLQDYDAWFADVMADRKGKLPAIAAGTDHEDPTVLTRQDYRGEGVVADPAKLGGWDLDVARAGDFDLQITWDPTPAKTLDIEVGPTHFHLPVVGDRHEATLFDVPLAAGPVRLRAWIRGDGSATGVSTVSLHRRGPSK